MQYKFLHDYGAVYDGSQLSSLYAYRKHKVRGDSIIAWVGPCEVKDHMIDIEDIQAEEFISSDAMLHFIIEIFDTPVDLKKAFLYQRLFTFVIYSTLLHTSASDEISLLGDDIYCSDKLSVSIATVNPVSLLVHTGLNVTKTGAPIPISCLNDVLDGIDPEQFANGVMHHFADQVEDILRQTDKVSPVI